MYKRERRAEQVATALLHYRTPTIRLAAFSLVATPTLKLTPFSPEVLNCLYTAIPCYHNEVDPQYRHEFLVVLKQMWKRLCSVTRQLRKELTVIPGVPIKRCDIMAIFKSYEAHKNLVRWYMQFLCEELQTTTPYHRHVMALNLLQPTIFEEKVLAATAIFSGGYYPASLIEQLLLDLVTDPFDDVRQLASQSLQVAYLLKLFSKPGISDQSQKGTPNGQSQHTHRLSVASKTAEARMQTTGRVDFADGLGRFYTVDLHHFGKTDVYLESLLKRLFTIVESDILTGPKDSRRATIAAPFQGHIVALRYQSPLDLADHYCADI